MSESPSRTVNWNERVIAEFRANEGRVGGNFEGAPMVLVHHRGRSSGKEYVNPMVYLPDEAAPDTIYVFASKGGAPTHPDWYRNLVAHPDVTVEVTGDTYPAKAVPLPGEERDRVFASIAERYPFFADHQAKVARRIPVVALVRA